jgi:peptidoglycan/LPS O-acetylase OafA/YrhL
MEQNIIRGRKIVGAIVIGMVVVSFLTIVFYVSANGTQKILTQIVRFGLTLLLGYFLFQGRNAAKWITIVLSALATIMAIPGIMLVTTSISVGLISLIYFVVYGLTTMFLLFSKDVKEFLDSKKSQTKTKQG